MTKDEAEKMVDAFAETVPAFERASSGAFPNDYDISDDVAGYSAARAALIAALTAPQGLPAWRTDMENAPDEPHLRGIWINVMKPNKSEVVTRYIDVYAGSIDDETGEFKTINGDDTGWPTDEFTLWCPLPAEAAAPPAPVVSVADAVAADRAACAALVEGAGLWKLKDKDRDKAIAAAIRARGQGGAT